jgi:glycine betaine/proline transport system permease protein
MFSWLIDDSGKIRVGKWGEALFKLFTDNLGWFFDGLKVALNFLIEGAAFLLLQVHPILLAVIFAAAVWAFRRSIPLAVGVFLALLFIINQGLWKETIQTLVLVVSATAVSMAVGVPLGIWAAHKPKVWRFLQPTLDLMQTMPTFVYLIPVLILFGLGAAPALIVTTIFAMPAPVRMTYLGLTTIPKPMLEAGTSFGATYPRSWRV